MTIDPGTYASGSSPGVQAGPALSAAHDGTEWQILTFHGELGASGQAGFGLVVEDGPVNRCWRVLVGSCYVVALRRPTRGCNHDDS
eukprot:SAG22_NODE_3251_length_1829_cov_11.154913_3_plen_86_part_00